MIPYFKNEDIIYKEKPIWKEHEPLDTRMYKQQIIPELLNIQIKEKTGDSITKMQLSQIQP